MVGRFQRPGQQVIAETEAGKHRDHMTALALVPTVATTGFPHRALHFPVDHCSVGTFCVTAHFDAAQALGSYGADAVEDVVHLRFDDEQRGQCRCSAR